MKNKFRILLGTFLGMPLGIIGMAIGSSLAVVFNMFTTGKGY